jgi:medium-chain acyl-CoA synthetase
VAALRMSVVLCTATTLLVEKDIQFRCLQSRAEVFIRDALNVATLQNIRLRCPGLSKVIGVGESVGWEDENVVDFQKALERIVPTESGTLLPRTRADNPALMFFTSGTSGPPKMVWHSHVLYPLGNVPVS